MKLVGGLIGKALEKRAAEKELLWREEHPEEAAAKDVAESLVGLACPKCGSADWKKHGPDHRLSFMEAAANKVVGTLVFLSGLLWFLTGIPLLLLLVGFLIVPMGIAIMALGIALITVTEQMFRCQRCKHTWKREAAPAGRLAKAA